MQLECTKCGNGNAVKGGFFLETRKVVYLVRANGIRSGTYDGNTVEPEKNILEGYSCGTCGNQDVTTKED